MINDELISKFFKQECSPEEIEAILNFFQEHPEELEKYISYREWEDFQTRQEISSVLSGRLWSKIAAVSLKKESYHLPAYAKVCLVAACMAIVLLVASLWQRPAEKAIHPKEMAVHAIINTGTDTMTVKLQDNTNVQLSGGSALTYSKFFSKSDRSIRLQGWACFRVAHRAIPFMVCADVLTIKDMGTIFSVQSFEKDSIIKIALYEGRVVVSSVEDTDRYFSLKPGDILLYNKRHKNFSLSSADQRSNIKPLTAKSKTTIKRYKPGFAGNNWYMFNNQPLSGVFDQLGKIYNVRIFYADSILHGMTFIGRLDKTDTLEELLKSIASLNNLKVEKNSKGYHIYK